MSAVVSEGSRRPRNHGSSAPSTIVFSTLRQSLSSTIVAGDNAWLPCYHWPRMPSTREDDKPARQLFCPYCQSAKVKILATTNNVTLCCCKECHAEFSVYSP